MNPETVKIKSYNVYFGRRNVNGANAVMVSEPLYSTTLRPKTRALDIKESQKHRNHSEGFDWGYGGSGPSQTAMAILLDYTGDPVEAERLHQDFKWDFVSGWDDTWRVTGTQIGAWLLQKNQATKLAAPVKAPVSPVKTSYKVIGDNTGRLPPSGPGPQSIQG